MHGSMGGRRGPRARDFEVLGALLSAWVGWLGMPACSAEHPIEGVGHELCVGDPSASTVVGEVLTPDVDVLVVIDDSGSMVEEQATLAANFSELCPPIPCLLTRSRSRWSR